MANYTPHEVRTIIRNCTTHYDLIRARLEIIELEGHNYSETLLAAFKCGFDRQRRKLISSELQ